MACVRDHYFELFDLEKNFGEKRFCPAERRTFPGYNKKIEPWKELSEALNLKKSRGKRSLRSPMNNMNQVTSQNLLYLFFYIQFIYIISLFSFKSESIF